MANYRCMGCMKEFDDNLKKCPHCSYIVGTSPAEPYFLAPETVLDGRYIVGKVLGSSALTITYLAWDCLEDCKIVIKEYFPINFSSRMPGHTEINTYDGEKAKQFESGLRAFITENSRLSELPANLEGVAHTKSVFIENSTAYTVIEYLEGVSFAKVVSDNKIPWHDVVEIMKPVLISLDSVHKSGLIHYNISPDNIIMTRDKKVKLLSFGSAKLEAVGNIKNLDLITKPGFSPIELYGDEPAGNAAVDIYSIAAIIYYAITGIVPQASIERASRDNLKTPKELGIAIPTNIENALMNALNVKAEYRIQSAKELADALSGAIELERVVVKPEKVDEGKWNRKTKVFAIIGAAVALIAILTIIITTKSLTSFSAVGENFPNLLGADEKHAIELLEDIGLSENNYKVVGILKNVEGKPGTIVWQSIEPGERLGEDYKNLVVDVKIAEAEIVVEDKTSDKAVMPALTAMTQTEAAAALEKAGFKNYSFQTRLDDIYAEGLVCYQSVEADKKIDKDTSVVIYIAKSPEQEEVVHTTQQNKVVETTKKQEPQKNEPVTQAPATTTEPPKKPSNDKNKKPQQNTTTTKEAPTTEAKVKVPNVAGMNAMVAMSTINGAGLYANENFVYIPGQPDQAGTVAKTSPAANSSQDKGTVITIYVYE